jgi:hypothetical protein
MIRLGVAGGGFDPDATPEQLWANNRGDWRLDKKRIASERWAALSYRGWIVLVAELHGPDHDILAANRTGASKKALIGRPLSDGHPIYEALIRTQVEPRRNRFRMTRTLRLPGQQKPAYLRLRMHRMRGAKGCRWTPPSAVRLRMLPRIVRCGTTETVDGRLQTPGRIVPTTP